MTEPAYQCPFCGAISHNPNDFRERYCGNCHRFDQPAPSFLRDFDSPMGYGGMALHFDKQGRPISMNRWGELKFAHDDDGTMGQTDYARIGLDRIGTVEVSTVWLGINHRFAPGPPIIFETMIFGLPGDESPCTRYATEPEALEGHSRTVADLQAGRTPWFMAQGGYDLGVEPCPVCHGEWHGLDDKTTGCPGPFASEREIKEWRRHQ